MSRLILPTDHGLQLPKRGLWMPCKMDPFLDGGLTGFFGGGSIPIALTRTTGDDNGTNGTSFTFTNANIADVAGPRLLVIAFSGIRTSGSNATINSVTVGGHAMTEVIEAGNLETPTGLYQLEIPAGHALENSLTANVVVTFSAELFACRYWPFFIRNYRSTTATHTAATSSGAATNLSRNINVEEGGCVIGVATWDEIAASFTHTGLTELAEALMEFEGKSSVAWLQLSNSTQTVAWNVTTTDSQNCAIACASWR